MSDIETDEYSRFAIAYRRAVAHGDTYVATQAGQAYEALYPDRALTALELDYVMLVHRTVVEPYLAEHGLDG